ncbi:bacterial translation initiation factor 2 (bIF-2) [Candidatus Koribacter versatilis Ellin345]|uniref:Translation initiation factor IF-2 n=1 Tax=Koribacter versatilis (strain Ellin345) TaxID=204669 RepID=IF2_KORVE|nr:translation initiation factor IF-2 [Candidatus Koribacter versatilis]Q1IIT3.1 RecName: Full=Translation initiation factor IF-2 [Candidatus Koribacter versatilis Ellin345]ABF43217.1 bacterial translation initiation factor 2 (bIF-2) [Candidatus Koribacter versatilis Ellin345]
MKIRINDLARELEVKSKAILDALTKVGVTEKKTHSSSIEDHEAVLVKKYIHEHGTEESPRRRSAGEDEFKPKIDLSKISKPGDVLKALTQKAAPPPPPPPPPRPAVKAPSPVSQEPRPPAVPPAPQKPAVFARPASETVHTPPEPPKPRFITPASVAAQRPVITPPKPPVPPAPPVAVAPPAVIEPAAPAEEPKAAAPATTAPEAPEVKAPVSPERVAPAADTGAHVTAKPEAPAAPGAATPAPTPGRPLPGVPLRQQTPGRRMIVPQTGPRPVYSAPPPAPPRPTPPPQMSQGAGTRPGMPVRGQPIFQRRPQSGPGGGSGGPGGFQRPGGPPRPGDRPRGPHPTRQFPSGPRPMGGIGLAPPGAPANKPAGRPAPARRPGQRYVPRGQKEGPMKGFVPPPRLSLSNEPLPITRNITISEGISVKDLAEKLGIRAKDLIARLLARGVFATVNQTLEASLASEMANHFGASTDVITFEDQLAQETAKAAGETPEEAAANAVVRPPVVTIMGHVDHGKTSLLDAIRATDVAGGEAGGITQHIGAYKVAIGDPNSPAFGREIVFLDTPGHEAFTRMRARGSKITDIVVIVVAADDGVMPQTVEAIDHARAANVPIIVAVNKIDKPDAMPERVKKQLADRGLMPEDWGGNTVFVDVSAKQKTNLNLLMEMICLVADLGDLKANPDRMASGTVVEAKLDRGRGPVATVLVQNGTLRTSDNFVVGNAFGKVRAMFNDRGVSLDTAGPSTPVEIIGLETLPQAGDQFTVVADREKARDISEYREGRAREAQLAKSSRVSLEGLAEQLKTAGQKDLPIILKGDVQGSVEVLNDLLSKMSTEKVKITMIRSGVGAITESDVLLASASNAIIIGFNVRPERKAQELAVQEGVDIRLHSIIYELQDEMKKAMLGLLEPIIKETYQGRADVKDTFRIPKVGTIAGCQVADGIIKRDSHVRLVRDNVVIYTGKIGSLKRFKDDASEVRNGMECGIGIAGYGDIRSGDVIEAFTSEKIAADSLH